MTEDERLATLKKSCGGPCGATKPWAEFWVMRRNPDGTVRQPQSYCKVCSRAQRRELNGRNRDRAREHSRRQYERIRNDPEAWAQRLANERERRRGHDEVQERRRGHCREYMRAKHGYNPSRYRGPNPNAQGKPRTDGVTGGAIRRGAGPLTWETAVWADGPRLVAWLEGQQLLPDTFGAGMDTIGSAVRKWRSGRCGRMDSVDNILTKLGAHVSELPDDVWLSERKAA